MIVFNHFRKREGLDPSITARFGGAVNCPKTD
jgi:hypothetical protein